MQICGALCMLPALFSRNNHPAPVWECKNPGRPFGQPGIGYALKTVSYFETEAPPMVRLPAIDESRLPSPTSIKKIIERVLPLI